jgi:hypothetical protein
MTYCITQLTNKEYFSSKNLTCVTAKSDQGPDPDPYRSAMAH